MFEYNSEIGTMRMHGEIGAYFEDGISELDVIRAFEEMDGQDVTINLRSDGGDVFGGLSIVNAIRSYSGNVTVVVDSLAASIASVITAAADEVAIHSGSMLMVHNPWTIALGDSGEFRAVADLLDKIAGEIAQVYADKSGKHDAGDFLEMMQQDTYLTAEEAIAWGLADRVVENKKSKKRDKEYAKREPVAACAGFPRRNLAEMQLRLKR